MGVSRWARQDGRPVKQYFQPKREVQTVLDLNAHIRNTPSSPGGRGSDNFKFAARVPTAFWAQWMHEWRQKGGQRGTGMKSRDYCMLKASLPDYSQFVATPSGKTGFERRARAIKMGYGQRALTLAPTGPREG